MEPVPSTNGDSFTDTTKTNNNNVSESIPILRPVIDNEIVKQMLKDNYGLSAVSLKPLNGYDDLNFHLKADPTHCNPHIAEVSALGYFVKVVNAEDSKRPEFQFAQKSAMEHLNSRGIPCQTAVKTLDGDFFSKIIITDAGEETTYSVSVRTFLPGGLVADAKFSAQLSFDLGLFVAKVSKAFEDFNDPFFKEAFPTWGMDNMPQVSTATHAVKNDVHKQISEEVIQAFNEEVMPKRDQFRQGLIHGDPNEQNILLQVPEGGSGYEICGLLDFQDCAFTYPIYDIAISMAYMMMLPNLEIPVVDVAGHMLAGYTSLIEFNKAEEESLRTLIAARMTMSLVYGAYTNMLDPTNEYVLTTAKTGWKVLTEFWGISKENVEKRWAEILQTYKSN